MNESLESPDDVKIFLNDLDISKRKADKQMKSFFRGTKTSSNLEEFRLLNDYVFRVFRDMWFIQSDWYSRNGRYFQGKETISTIPKLGRNSKVEIDYGLTDQVENWRDIGYEDQYAPVSIRSDIYSGPKGDGYTITASFLLDGKVWKMQMHQGPEEREESFIWVQQ